MKIVRGHDYYDGAGWGVDPDIVFVREPREISDPPFVLPKPLTDRSLLVSLHFFFVLIGGEVHPGLRETRHYGSRQKLLPSGAPSGKIIKQYYREILHYNLKDAMAPLTRICNFRNRTPFLFRDAKDDLVQHFQAGPTKAQIDWMITEKVVTGIVERDGYSRAEDPVARVNSDEMKDYEVFRLKDPASTHMAISAWLGGVLPSGPETVGISDESKIRKAGFDTRSSFRQDPGVKKPRKRKKSGA